MNEEPAYNFDPGEPALCVAHGYGGEGVYRQRDRCWYWNGRNAACQIQHLGHLTQQELILYGRKMLEMKYRNGSTW